MSEVYSYKCLDCDGRGEQYGEVCVSCAGCGRICEGCNHPEYYCDCEFEIVLPPKDIKKAEP